MSTRTVVRAAACALALAAITQATASPAAAQKPTTKPVPRQVRSAQASFDRTAIPPAGKTPELSVPAWTTEKLSNGAQLIVSQRKTLPLVSFTITWLGGADQYEPADKTGLASFTAAMLSEGTTHRSGDQLSSDLQMLGTSISTGISGEDGSMGFVALKDRVEPTLAILQDELVNPTFPADALERLRARTLVSLTQARDRTSAIAHRVFPKVVYGEAHPYGRSMTEASVKAITRDDIVAFHKAYFTPAHAIITVVGDVDPATVRATVERALAAWPAGGSAPSFDYPALPAPKPTTIYLVDKPGAAQSSFAIGLPGPPRDTPDYFALRVLNTILGDQFQSRLNADIREQKGFSYGVGSSFDFGKGPGAFEAGGDIVSAKSDSALIEFMKHLKGIHGGIPVTDEELKTAQDNLVQGLPEQFASVSSVNGAITELYTEGLPQDYYQRFAAQVRAITKADLQ
ncbi:MAG TPA: pitrilysin family protein, partial [Longimicrobiales bacterium]